MNQGPVDRHRFLCRPSGQCCEAFSIRIDKHDAQASVFVEHASDPLACAASLYQGERVGRNANEAPKGNAVKDFRAGIAHPFAVRGWVIRARRKDGLPIRSRVERKSIAGSRIGQSVLQVKTHISKDAGSVSHVPRTELSES